MNAQLVIFLAELVTDSPWTNLVTNGGIAGAVIGWFMWRDYRRAEADERQHKQTTETLNALASGMQKSIVAQMITVEAIKTLDSMGVKDMAKAMREEAEVELRK